MKLVMNKIKNESFNLKSFNCNLSAIYYKSVKEKMKKFRTVTKNSDIDICILTYYLFYSELHLLKFIDLPKAYLIYIFITKGLFYLYIYYLGIN